MMDVEPRQTKMKQLEILENLDHMKRPKKNLNGGRPPKAMQLTGETNPHMRNKLPRCLSFLQNERP